MRDDAYNNVEELLGLAGAISRDVESIHAGVGDLQSERTFEITWFAVQRIRSEAWIEFNRRLERGELPELASRAGRLLFQAFFFDEVDPSDLIGNWSELSA